MKNLPLNEEQKLNEAGDRLATMLGLRIDHEASPDSQGRARWKTTIGNKTGVGLLRTIERFVADEVKAAEHKA